MPHIPLFGSSAVSAHHSFAVLFDDTKTVAVTLLKRRGWTKDSLKPGDVVTVGGWPSRDAANYKRMRTITKADGTVLGTPVTNQRAD